VSKLVCRNIVAVSFFQTQTYAVSGVSSHYCCYWASSKPIYKL